MKLDRPEDFNAGYKALPIVLKYGQTRRQQRATANRNIKANYCANYWKGILKALDDTQGLRR